MASARKNPPGAPVLPARRWKSGRKWADRISFHLVTFDARVAKNNPLEAYTAIGQGGESLRIAVPDDLLPAFAGHRSSSKRGLISSRTRQAPRCAHRSGQQRDARVRRRSKRCRWSFLPRSIRGVCGLRSEDRGRAVDGADRVLGVSGGVCLSVRLQRSQARVGNRTQRSHWV